MTAIRKNPAGQADQKKAAVPVRRRLSPADRERQIVDGAVRFFSEHGLGGQLRDLARQLGTTHTLLYHYFPTKQALIERVYADLFEGRWRPAWEGLLDDKALDVESKFTRFYTEYAKVILERDWVRIFIFSGLSDGYITERYFSMLGEKLFPRLVRESRLYRGKSTDGLPTLREIELLMGLHGGIFYMGLRRWVYGHPLHDEKTDAFDEALIRDRVRGYLLSIDELMDSAFLTGRGSEPLVHPSLFQRGALAETFRRVCRSPQPAEEVLSWPIH
jgi:AcrR family transcriptional regulator